MIQNDQFRSRQQQLFTASSARDIDTLAIKQQFNNDDYILMQRAGKAAYNLLANKYYNNLDNIIIICGPGNNGGDGLVVAGLYIENYLNSIILNNSQGHNIDLTIILLTDKKGLSENLTSPSKKAYEYLSYQIKKIKQKLINNKHIKSNLNYELCNTLVIPAEEPGSCKLEPGSTRFTLDREDKAFTSNAGTVNINFIIDDQDIFNNKNLINTDFEKTVCIDAVFGIGINKSPDGIYKQAIEYINKFKNIIAIDIPSGLACDTGKAYSPTVKAKYTISFIVQKQGCFTGDGRDCSGEIYYDTLDVSDLIYQSIVNNSVLLTKEWSSVLLKQYLPKRYKNSYKHQFGHIIIIGGNSNMAGAVLMAARAALRTGAGIVTLITHSRNKDIINQQPELMINAVSIEEIESNSDGLLELLNKANGIIIGPGMGQDEWAKILFDYVLSNLECLYNNNIYNNDRLKSIIIDADGLNLLSNYFLTNNIKCLKLADRLVLTPHLGEAKKLLSVLMDKVKINTIINNRFETIDNLIKLYQCTVVLKGAGSIVASYNNILNTGTKPAICKSGNPGMATAGMGDILTGIIAGLSTQIHDLDLITIVCLAVFLHGEAGDELAEENGERGIIATDILTKLRTLINAD